ncbi:MAG TPA: protein-L-isoaspartate O-methyltransferase [Acetobacteraceae bacterium]|jgi:protein-L-isoaspartate(D-aspartate) O-methyltransferase|nr:protein-L-isoaspartate O-methyltransferase [Acetobacteraceae bacterium]
MDRPILSYTDARNMMVDGQVRPNKVTDPRILDAMRRLPRERFLPPELASLAYADEDVTLPGGRALIEPMVIARLVQLLALRSGDRALVVGAGYGAALCAACGASVTAVEEDEAMLRTARAVLPELAPEVSVVAGKLAEGWAGAGRYEAILIEGAVEFVPEAIAGQLEPTAGRLVTVLAGTGRLGRAVIGERNGEGLELSFQPVFDCATPALPQFRRAAAFVF